MKETSNFFIDFDSIFDTRLGTLLKHFTQDEVQEEMKNNYFNRATDAFKIADFQTFKKLYEQRDKSVLLRSMKTVFVDLLLEFVAGIIKNSINGYEQKKPKIIFNTYPYELSKEELELIKEQWTEMTKGFCIIEFTRLSPQQVTPIYLYQDIDAFSMYNYTDWLELHSVNENLKRRTLPSVALFGPKIIFKEQTQEEKNFLRINNIDPFSHFEKHVQPIVALRLLPVYFYSAAILEQAAQQKKSTL